jgi:phosphoribosyl-AMP cyclohydrolase
MTNTSTRHLSFVICHSLQTFFKALQFNRQGLIPTVIQDAASKRVLTLCYLNREALEKSLREGKVYVFRRSQKRLMLKGETSGHLQAIREVHVDCEGKSLLLLVQPRIAACHAGYFSCYFRRLTQHGRLTPAEPRVFDPAKVYQTVQK